MIKPVDIPSEKLSPFFKKNEEICLGFEKNIKNLGGSVIGSYGAWSFKASGRIEGDPLCVYKIEKSTYTRDRYLLFKSLYTLSEWQYKSSKLKDFKVKIKKANVLDNLGLSTYSKINGIGNYVISEPVLKGSLVEKLIEILSKYLIDKELILLSISNSILKIKIKSKDYSLNSANKIRNLLKKY